MTPERWQQVKELFESALERAPDERAAFLDHTCDGDESLRREVESLLASYEGGESFNRLCRRNSNRNLSGFLPCLLNTEDRAQAGRALMEVRIATVMIAGFESR